jgi:hypothetical protein
MASQSLTYSDFQGFTTYALPGGTYNPDHLGLGSLMVRKTGGSPTDKWIGPKPVALARPFEQSASIPGNSIHVIPWSDTIDWVFYGDAASAAGGRRVGMYEFNKATDTFTWKGFVNFTYPPSTNHTLRGMRMLYSLHTTGTIAASGTTITGTSTTWSADEVNVGSRIGFGSTDPTQISTWYEITAVGSNTSITVNVTPGTISAGAAYVIEDLSCITATTNATATNGGLFITKGLRPEIFIAAGTTISAATTADNARLVYWLADAGTVTNTVACGIILEPEVNKTTQYAWVIDGTANVKLFKYNVRVALAGLASGKSTSAFVHGSATQAVTGTNSQLNNGRYAVASHGPGSGKACGYFCTTTRIYRTLPLSQIGNSMPWQADVAVEVPPGSSAFGVTNAMNNIEYSSTLDMFLVLTTQATGARSYVTKYNAASQPFDRIIFSDLKQIDATTASANTTPAPQSNSTAAVAWVEGGICYYLKSVATNVGTLVAFPLGADWEYASATSQRIILPKFDTPNADTLQRAYVASAQVVGGATGQNLGLQTEPYRLLARTGGIDDNSGEWSVVPDTGDLSAFAAGAAIQFALEFRTIGVVNIPARVYSVTLIYDDVKTDSHYQPSVGKSSTASKYFAWRHATAFGGTVPTLRIRLYDAVTGGLLLDDDSATPIGTWQRSTDGTSWGSFVTTDKGNETTYIRYTPASLADNIKVRAVLTLL